VTDQYAAVSIDAVTSVPQALRYAVWRDGVLQAQNLSARTWLDPERLTPGRRHCYRVVAKLRGSGNASHPSAASCINDAATRTMSWPAGGNSPAMRFRVERAGMYALSLTYDNHAFDINTGVTNAVKRIELMNGQGRIAATGVIQMPHIQPEGATHPYRQSTELRFFLDAGDYVLKGSGYFNMSYLPKQRRLRSCRGQSGPLNDALVQELQITRMP